MEKIISIKLIETCKNNRFYHNYTLTYSDGSEGKIETVSNNPDKIPSKKISEFIETAVCKYCGSEKIYTK